MNVGNQVSKPRALPGAVPEAKQPVADPLLHRPEIRCYVPFAGSGHLGTEGPHLEAEDGVGNALVRG